MKTYIIFSLVFFVIHFVCYTLAGIIDLQLAKKMYSGKNGIYFPGVDQDTQSFHENHLRQNFPLS